MDDGVLFGFHRMNAFTGMEQIPGIHFHDVEKNADIRASLKLYQEHLTQIFLNTAIYEYLSDSNS